MSDRLVLATEELLRAASELSSCYTTPIRGCVTSFNVVKPNGRYVVISDALHGYGKGVILNDNIEDENPKLTILWHRQKDSQTERHFYNTGKTIIMLSGEMTIKTPYAVHNLCGVNNDILYIPPGVPHSGIALSAVSQLVIFDEKLALNVMDKPADDQQTEPIRATA